jgi:hypothetical protein
LVLRKSEENSLSCPEQNKVNYFSDLFAPTYVFFGLMLRIRRKKGKEKEMKRV